MQFSTDHFLPDRSFSFLLAGKHTGDQEAGPWQADEGGRARTLTEKNRKEGITTRERTTWIITINIFLHISVNFPLQPSNVLNMIFLCIICFLSDLIRVKQCSWFCFLITRLMMLNSVIGYNSTRSLQNVPSLCFPVLTMSASIMSFSWWLQVWVGTISRSVFSVLSQHLLKMWTRQKKKKKRNFTALRFTNTSEEIPPNLCHTVILHYLLSTSWITVPFRFEAFDCWTGGHVFMERIKKTPLEFCLIMYSYRS